MKLPYKNSHGGIKILGQKWEEDNILGRYVVTEYMPLQTFFGRLYSNSSQKKQGRTIWESNMRGLTTYPLPPFP